MMPSIDAIAVAAFTDEFRSSLPAIVAAIDNASRDRNDRVAAREAHRLIHALKGAASMVGLAAFGYLLNDIEEVIEKAIAVRGPIGDDVIAQLGAAMPLCQAYMETSLNGRPVEPVARQLIAVLHPGDHAAEIASVQQLIEIETREMEIEPAETASLEPAPNLEIDNALADLPLASIAPPPVFTEKSSPAPPQALAPDFDVVPSQPVPPELAEIFGLEAQEHLDTIARLTAELNPDMPDLEGLQELRRSVHTFKGAAGVVGYLGASKLAHRMEDLLDSFHEQGTPLTAQAARTLASSSDALHDMIAGPADVDKLRAMVIRLFGEFDRLTNAAPATPQIIDTPPPAEHAVTEVVSEAPAVERRRREIDRRAEGPVLRVPVTRLNELVRGVSELVINRSTFEQHHRALIEEIDELKLSTARLRRITHKLESDYEVRALGGNLAMIGSGRTDAGSSGGHGFDDLEFDRYTEFHLLTRELTEITSDIATIATRVAATSGDFDSDLTRLGRLTRDIQDKTMEFRMVPLGSLTTKLQRAVRTTGEMCGKRVGFRLEGDQVALDKALLEQMSDPLLHLLRNAVDHGLERPEQRVAAGKPERGLITVRAFHEGTDVLIEVEDDGAGLDVERIRKTAIARGYVTESAAASLTLDTLFGFIFEPGFSTAKQITEVSGRGVGMDVVKARVTRLGGRVYVTSRPGEGTTISIRVPMTLAITRVLLVRCGGEIFGLPLGAVIQITRPHPTSIGLVGAERVFTLDGRTYPLWDLAETLGLSRPADAPAVQPILIANLSRRRIALAVDEIINSRDAVVKTLGSHLRRVPGVWGATLLGDGTVVLILNPADLAGAAEGPVVVRKPAPTFERGRYNVLIVDDSLSMRHVLSTAVKKAGWTPVPARDGLEALDLMQRGPQPDLVLLDIEMPRMDGFEFLATVRGHKGHGDVPIVMLTSRSGEKHRDKAMSLGATDYMVKPFQEDALLRNIDRLIQASKMSERRAS